MISFSCLISLLCVVNARINFGPNVQSRYVESRDIRMTEILQGDLRMSSSYKSHNGVVHSYYTQYFNDLSIVNAVTNINTKDGKVLSYGQILYRESPEDVMEHQIRLNADLNEPSISPLEAVESFMKYLKLEHAELSQEPENYKDKDSVYYVDGLLKESVPVSLKYLLLENGRLALVWDMVVDLNENWYHAHICAKTGKALQVLDWIADSAYRVFPFGTNDPNEGPRKLITNPQNLKASPAGWHTMGPMETKPITVTMGNNVYAQENKEGQDNWKKNYRPDGGKSLVFDFYANLTDKPQSYLDASIVNLFYWNNIIHDLFYLYGFDEAAGNFQEYNFHHEGKQGDGVIANAQDGSGFNNANFGTPPDGQRPRMRMYVWDVVTPMHDGDLESGIIIHEYAHGISTRLTGGPMNVGCLGWGESGGMGEGWGDFFATTLRMNENHTRHSNFSMGEYSAGRGIRNYKYSTYFEVNPSTYAYIKKPGYWGVHAKGEVWAEILYNVFWNVVDEFGFSKDWFKHHHSKKKEHLYGNKMMMQNVVDGLKLQPCYPTFIDARDAIILADKLNYNGITTCLMWRAFAARGLGQNAEAGGNEDFTVPKKCKEPSI